MEPPSPRSRGASERVLRLILVVWVTLVICDMDKGTIYEFGNASAQSAHEVVEVESDTVLFLKKFFECHVVMLKNTLVYIIKIAESTQTTNENYMLKITKMVSNSKNDNNKKDRRDRFMCTILLFGD